MQVQAGNGTFLKELETVVQESKLQHYAKLAEEIAKVPWRQITKALKVLRRTPCRGESP